MRQVSVLGIMGLVLASALAMAAVRNANDLWAGFVLLADLAALGAAILGAAYGRGRARAWWLGFALFAGGYLALTFAPWLSDEFRPKLGTTRLFDLVYQRVTGSTAPLPPNLSDLLKLRTTAKNRLAKAQQIARNPSDPSIVALQRKVVDVNLQIAAVGGNVDVTALSDAAAGLATTPAPNPWRAALPGAQNYEPFQRVGHGLCAILTGLAGGATAAHFQRRREQQAVDETREDG